MPTDIYLFCKGYCLQLYIDLEFSLQLLYALEKGQRGVIHVDGEPLGPENPVPVKSIEKTS
jgi:hypothetical protein